MKALLKACPVVYCCILITFLSLLFVLHAYALERVIIATATASGVYYPLGNAMAQIFNKKIPMVKASVLATAGTPENISLLAKNKATIAFAQSGVVYYAYHGRAVFSNKPMKTLRGITHNPLPPRWPCFRK